MKEYNLSTSEENLDIRKIQEGYLNGFHLKKKGIECKGSVITFGGSEGSPYYSMAKVIANNGYEIFALYFFGQDNQPKQLSRIPIEFFNYVVLYIKKHFSSLHPLSIVGASKGAELSLLLAENYSEIDNLILIAPSTYRFQGLDIINRSSSWTYNNEDLPYISFKDVSMLEKIKLHFEYTFMLPVKLKLYYDSAIENTSNIEEARIKAEKFKGNMLILLGEDDGMWNSYNMAFKIKEAKSNNTEIVVYQNVGHAFGEDRVSGKYFMGGQSDLNKIALTKSYEKILDTMQIWYTQ
jgi:esterase/lipase